MKIWLLLMWLHGDAPSPLFIGAYETQAQCLAERPKYDRPYSFGHCSYMTVIPAPKGENDERKTTSSAH